MQGLRARGSGVTVQTLGHEAPWGLGCGSRTGVYSRTGVSESGCPLPAPVLSPSAPLPCVLLGPIAEAALRCSGGLPPTTVSRHCVGAAGPFLPAPFRSCRCCPLPSALARTPGLWGP